MLCTTSNGMKGEFKQILLDVFGVLGFSDAEKEKALENFKKKLAFEMMNSLKYELSAEQQEWIENPSGGVEVSKDDLKITEIQQTIQGLYSEEELYQKTKEIFRKILQKYIQFMSSDLEADSVSMLNGLLARL